MAKAVNITDKLDFESNPILVIGNVEAEVNADAESVLRLIGTFSEKRDMEAISYALNIIFKKEDVEAICKIEKDGKKLSAKSLMKIIEAAMDLVMGEDEGE